MDGRLVGRESSGAEQQEPGLEGIFSPFAPQVLSLICTALVKLKSHTTRDKTQTKPRAVGH